MLDGQSVDNLAKSIDISYDADSYIIDGTYHGEYRDFIIVVSEIDTGYCILVNGLRISGGFWISPFSEILKNKISKGDKRKYFNGFRVSFLDSDRKFLFDKEIRLANNAPVFLHTSPLEQTYEFFVDFFEDDIEQGMMSDNDVIIDVGAHQGFFTAYSIWKGCKSVYSIEPIPVNVKYLMRNFSFLPNVHIIPKALSVDGGTKVIHNNPDSSCCASLSEAAIPQLGDNYNTIDVDTITFDEIRKRYGLDRISLLKIDIEGYEYEWFQSMDEGAIKTIDKMIIDFHYNHDGRLERDILPKLEGFDIFYREGYNSSSYQGYLHAVSKKG